MYLQNKNCSWNIRIVQHDDGIQENKTTQSLLLTLFFYLFIFFYLNLIHFPCLNDFDGVEFTCYVSLTLLLCKLNMKQPNQKIVGTWPAIHPEHLTWWPH